MYIILSFEKSTSFYPRRFRTYTYRGVKILIVFLRISGLTRIVYSFERSTRINHFDIRTYTYLRSNTATCWCKDRLFFFFSSAVGYRFSLNFSSHCEGHVPIPVFVHLYSLCVGIVLAYTPAHPYTTY